MKSSSTWILTKSNAAYAPRITICIVMKTCFGLKCCKYVNRTQIFRVLFYYLNCHDIVLPFIELTLGMAKSNRSTETICWLAKAIGKNKLVRARNVDFGSIIESCEGPSVNSLNVRQWVKHEQMCKTSGNLKWYTGKPLRAVLFSATHQTIFDCLHDIHVSDHDSEK